MAGVKRGRGRGNLGARERVGRAREKGKEPLLPPPSSLAPGLAPYFFASSISNACHAGYSSVLTLILFLSFSTDHDLV